MFGPPPLPSWSADGAWLAYRTATGLTIVRPDGTARREILKGHVGAYAWDPQALGISAIVTEAIDPATGAGRVRVEGEDWRGASLDELSLPAGTRISVVQVNGTILVVEKEPVQ